MYMIMKILKIHDLFLIIESNKKLISFVEHYNIPNQCFSNIRPASRYDK